MKSCSISRIWAGIWPMPRVNIPKNVKNHGFPRKIIYKWWVLQIWVFRRVIYCDEKLLMKEMTTWHCVTAMCINLQDPSTFEPRLIQPPDCYSMWKDSPQPRPKTLQEHGKTPFSFSIFRQKYPHHSAATSSVSQQGSRPRKDLPRSVELFFDAASPAQAYVKLFVTFLGTVSHLKWLGGLFSLAMCVLALKIFHPATLMVGMLTFDGWILLLLYHYIPLDPGWNSLFLCDFVHETLLWSRYLLECSPMFSDFCCSQHTEWRHTVAFQFFNWFFVLL